MKLSFTDNSFNQLNDFNIAYKELTSKNYRNLTKQIVIIMAKVIAFNVLTNAI